MAKLQYVTESAWKRGEREGKQFAVLEALRYKLHPPLLSDRAQADRTCFEKL